MKKREYTLTELHGCVVRESGKKAKRIGKVRSAVFHPRKRAVVGFTVKRPDIALMAHRPDLFVAYDAFDVVEGDLVVSGESGATGKAACKRLGVDWDECVIWQGMPLLTEGGKRLGLVGDVRFRTEDGSVICLMVDRGKSADILLGLTELPARYIKGFKLGVGDALSLEDGDDFAHGAIIVADEALDIAAEGGLAEQAGVASAQVADKVSKAVDRARPAASEAAHKAEDAVNRGAYAVGQQLSRTKGMFGRFKEEYRRALDEGDDKPDE